MRRFLKPVSSSLHWLGFATIAGIMKTPCLFLVAIFTLGSISFAVDPPPDGGYPNENTAEGEDALFNLTTGAGNTAVGFEALFNDTTGGGNTAAGWQALSHNTTGSTNTAYGTAALSTNTTGYSNTATGHSALLSNTTGQGNTAQGVSSLFWNATGDYNTAVGVFALYLNGTGSGNTALGVSALTENRFGSNNTAVGFNAIYNAAGGDNNIAIGFSAGINCKGSNNIEIGNDGDRRDQGVIRIGNKETHGSTYIAGISGVPVPNGAGVVIAAGGRLGTVTSSSRYKEAIKPMEISSEAVLSLRPVRFRYKKELDPQGIPQFGLVAEEVAKVDPDLVVSDEDGKPYAVRYEAVNAMLLNEFLKEHQKVEEQAGKIEQLETRLEQIAARLDAKGR